MNPLLAFTTGVVLGQLSLELIGYFWNNERYNSALVPSRWLIGVLLLLVIFNV